MTIKMSPENSERFVSSAKLFSDIGTKYWLSLNDDSTGSGKKFVNALLLIPVIVPTAVTISCFFCTYLLLNAVSAKKDDSKLFKVLKGTVRLSIYVAAFVILAACAILNLVISLIPSLILLAINRDLFNQKKSDDVEGKINNITVQTDEECKNLVGDILTQGSSDGSEQPIGDDVLNQISGQPKITIISQETGDRNELGKIVVVENINDRNTQDGAMVMKTASNRDSLTIEGIMIGDHPEQGISSASAFYLGINAVEGGVDMKFNFSSRPGETKQKARENLQKSPLGNGVLSSLTAGNNGQPLLTERHVASSDRVSELPTP